MSLLSSILYPLSSILYPLSSILYPLSSILSHSSRETPVLRVANWLPFSSAWRLSTCRRVDNVGLLIGDRQRDVRQVLTCLTLTPMWPAKRSSAGRMIVTHHPVPFRHVKRLTADDDEGQMLLALIVAGIAVYSPHTAYDSARDGINQQLAQVSGIDRDRTPAPTSGRRAVQDRDVRAKSHLAGVQQALWSAGAGVIGEYSKCASSWRAPAASKARRRPTCDRRARRLEEVAEARLEVICPNGLSPKRCRLLREAHPMKNRRATFIRSRPARAPRIWARGCAVDRRWHRGCAKISLARIPGAGEHKTARRAVALCGRPAAVDRTGGDRLRRGGRISGGSRQQSCDVLLTGEARFHTCWKPAPPASHWSWRALCHRTPGHGISGRRAAREFPGISAWPAKSNAIRYNGAEEDFEIWISDFLSHSDFALWFFLPCIVRLRAL